MKFLLDTDICSAHMRRPAQLAHRFIQHTGQLAISTVTLDELSQELDQYLAGEYGVAVRNRKAYEAWRKSHQPFHWFAEFYGIMHRGGFDVIIGNPPYVEIRANAVAHRDYSSYVRGSYIRVRMFADRLEVQSPGGLHGTVTVDNLEDEHSTRNARLMRMMEDLHVVENRGSGIRSMLQALRAANLEPPKFDDRRSSFMVTFRNHTLLNPQAIAWLNQFANRPLNDRQRLALLYVRQHGQITNPDYRRLNQVDPLVAGRELRSLVESALVEQEGTRRWTSYRLQVSPDVPSQIELSTEEKEIPAWIAEKKSITNKECRQLLGVGSTRAYYLLKRLCDAGRIKSTGAGKGRRYWLP